MRGVLIAERFELERKVGEGGMGTVYRALDRHTDALAAVKLVRSADSASAERFAREASVLAELRHPAIVRYLTHGRTETGELFLAMEWLEGEDLAHCLRSRELDTGEALHLLGQVAGALAAAHARGIVHRDIKPANLFLVDYRLDRAKLLDFGVARVERLDTMTATGAVVGTPRFMAPEQASGKRSVDARADVFALGAVLYRCLAGRDAFGGDSAAEALAQVLHSDPTPLAAWRPDLPSGIVELVARMLAKEPAARPRDAAAVLADILALDLTLPRGSQGRPRSAELTGEESKLRCVVVIAQADLGARAAATVAAHDGRIESLEDQSVIALAGHRVASDQAKLAARCALALRRELGDVAMALAMGRRSGEAVARARALLGGGAAIRVDPDLAGLLDARFQLSGDAQGLVLTGEAADDSPRPLLGRATPFVGREAELAQLSVLLEASTRDSAARVVLVTAPPGTGKSRLRMELTRGRSFWIGRGEPMHAGAPFALLGGAILRAAGIAGEEPLHVRRRLLAERVGRHLPAERAAPVAEMIGELCGVPFPEDSVPLRAARRDPSLMAERLRQAWVDWLAAECAAAPVLLVLEDLHWGDLPTVKLCDDALAALADRPLFILALGRPETRELFPRLWGDRGLQEIHLGALLRRSAERLVRQVLPDARDEDVSAIVERAGGNAFYLEELIRHVAEHGARAFPGSVLAMVAARFEQLGPEERRTLRAASVFGEVFWARGVATLLGESEARLEELVGRELIIRRQDPRLAGQEEYAFRHSLLREGAYALLTDDDRALGHRLAGDWLAAAGEPEALVLAEHFERGGAAAAAAGWFARAGAQALAGSDAAGALARAERGIACGPTGAQLGELHLLRARALRQQGDPTRTIEAALLAVALLAPGSEPWLQAVAEAAMACALCERVEDLRRLAEDALAAVADPLSAAAAITFSRIAIQCGIGRGPRALYDTLAARLDHLPAALAADAGVACYVAEALVYREGFAGRLEAGYAQLLRAETLARAAGDARNACQHGTQLATYEGRVGDLERALARLDSLIPELSRLRMPMVERFAHLGRALVLLQLGRKADSLEEAERAAKGYAGMASQMMRIGFAGGLAGALEENGRGDEAEVVWRTAKGGTEPTVSSATIMPLTWFARFLVRRGQPEEALALLARLPWNAEIGEPTLCFWGLEARLALVEAHLALGRVEEARRSVRDARAWVEERLRAVLPPERWEVCSRRNASVAKVLNLSAELT